MPRLRLLVCCSFALFGAPSSNGQDSEVITRAIDVRQLTAAEANLGRPVEITGIVTFSEQTAVFVQDDTSTVFFRPLPNQVLRPGDRVRVYGCTRMGLYLPGLGDCAFDLLGSAPLPRGRPATYDDVVFARYHYQRVTVQGIVRSIVATNVGRSVLRLAMGARILEIRFETPPPVDHLLVDSVVEIQGLAAGFTRDRRIVHPYVRVQDWNDVTVLREAIPAAAVPRIPSSELLAYRPEGAVVHRVGVRGTVAAVFGRELLYLRDDTRAFGARLAEPSDVAVGDQVELLGFPEMADHIASVVDVTLTRRSAGQPPEPREVPGPDDLTHTHNGQLMKLSGRVSEAHSTGDGLQLVLSGRDRVLPVKIPDTRRRIEPGTEIEVIGICQVEEVPGSSFTSAVGGVSVLARSAADVRILQAPPWWTPQRLAAGLGLLVAVTLLAGLWIAVLRRQVQRQTNALRHRIEVEAQLEERQRIAREFHDTLEQELAGVSLRLDALATRVADAKGVTLIAASRNLVSRIQTETRDLISDLRDPTELSGDLVAALRGVAARKSSDAGVDIRLEVQGTLPTLPAAVVHDLRMMARESATNAVKHGQATEVRLELEAASGSLTLRVVDNGRGFDPGRINLERRGHFGCAGIRERGRKLGAQVSWHTTPGNGTTVEITLPLAGTTARSTPGPTGNSAPVEAAPATPRLT